jgi:hypothetical protein
MFKRLILSLFIFGGLSHFIACGGKDIIRLEAPAPSLAPSYNNTLPGNWRPFVSNSPWNQTIKSDAKTHQLSDQIISFMSSKASKIRFSNSYNSPLWVVDSRSMPSVIVSSSKIFDTWDKNRDGKSDVGIPWVKEMWPEQTSDSHLCIVDPYLGVAWEMSRFQPTTPPQCTTFNLWILNLGGYGDNPNVVKTDRWWARGGRGSGFPIIANMLRPEEVQSGEVRHTLGFTFSQVYDDTFIWPPACRADGDYVGNQYPKEGMLFQLVATEQDFTNWGLSNYAKVVARCLVKYGMYLDDKGGDMAIHVQLLDKDSSIHRQKWDSKCPGLYSGISKIPTNRFRLVYNGEPVYKKG